LPRAAIDCIGSSATPVSRSALPFITPQEAAIDVDPSARTTDLESGPIDPVLLHAMSWSAEFAIPCVPPAVGLTLRRLATAAPARAVVEIGTGLGVSGLWLLQGMPLGATLTTVDVEADHHAMARQSFAAGGSGPPRTRLITGHSGQILPRLADAMYDLVVIDVDAADHATCTEAAHRLLRPGGIVAVHAPAPGIRLDRPAWTPVPGGPNLLCAART
jgi:predicted O-methyltransferase YrrM